MHPVRLQVEVPDKVGRALARPEKCHIREGVEIY